MSASTHLDHDLRIEEGQGSAGGSTTLSAPGPLSTSKPRTSTDSGSRSPCFIHLCAEGERVVVLRPRYGRRAGMGSRRALLVVAVWTVRDGRSRSAPSTSTEAKPSKPWACRSRRCRGERGDRAPALIRVVQPARRNRRRHGFRRRVHQRSRGPRPHDLQRAHRRRLESSHRGWFDPHPRACGVDAELERFVHWRQGVRMGSIHRPWGR